MTEPVPLSDIIASWEKRQMEREQAGREALRSACDQLKKLGVDNVVITYDGYGDSGVLEAPVAQRGEERIAMPDELSQQIMLAVEEILPGGWEINEGAFGQLVLDVTARKLTREHNWRITETEYEEEEFPL